MTLADELIKLEQLRDRGTLTPEEFARAKARLLDTGVSQAPGISAINRFRRSQSDRWLGGICGGLAELTGLASWVWRILFTLLLFIGGTGLIVYIVLWIFVPSD